MPTLPQGRLLVLCFSLVLSCVVMGISISLLHSPIPDIPPGPSMSKSNWRWNTKLSHRDDGAPTFDRSSFRVVQILATVTSASNLFVAAMLLGASFSKRKNMLSVVAIEAPLIYVVSFMWLATGAYAEHKVEIGPGYFSFLDTPECVQYKVVDAIAFINWIQLMLYANTLMTVATICHVRKRPVWFHPITELPTFSAPALTFGSRPDEAFDSPFMTKTNESEVPILGASSRSADSRTPSHFRSRPPFLQHTSPQQGVPPETLSLPPPSQPPSDSVATLTRSLSEQSEIAAAQNAPSHSQTDTGHRIVAIGEPPTYSGPGSTYELVPV